MSVKDIQAPSARKQEIVKNYIELLDSHIAELKAGTAETTLKIEDFARALFIHPRHLSNTVHEVTGESTCSMYENRLMDISRALLLSSEGSIASVARHLMYDPSNFSKFFKSYEGMTPKQFRMMNKDKN